jgi:peptidoglycan/LPS O-acetylase OafA/YrhL
VYLLHDPILAIVWKYIVMPMNLRFYWLQTIAELAIGMLITIIASMVFYKWVELPCHQLSKSIVKR